jgi:predicted transcriptional regulator
MPAPKPETLTRREREIMDAVFALGNRASAEDIRARLTHPPSNTAVRAMLARLETKGHIRHREEGLRYVYSAVTSRSVAGRSALHQLVRIFFDGSPKETVAALLKQENWTDDELEALRLEIDKIRKEKRR